MSSALSGESSGFSDTSDVKACEYVLCYKEDPTPVASADDSSPNYATWELREEDIPEEHRSAVDSKYYGQVTLRYKVDCGIRKKLTLCPLFDGLNQGCLVKKVCGAPGMPTPSPYCCAAGHPVMYYYGESSTEIHEFKAQIEANNNALWNALTSTSGFKAHVAQTCATPCGFF